jgi:hypothetical protein
MPCGARRRANLFFSNQENDVEFRTPDLEKLPATLIFDTASRRTRHGFRRGQDPSRHVLFEAGDLCLDLRLDYDLASGAVAVHGQLADRRDPLKGMPGTPVMLLDGDRVSGWTLGNRNGEFELELVPGRGVRLCLPITGRGQIEIELDPLCEPYLRGDS